MYTAAIPSNAQRLAVVNAAYIPAWLISPVLTVVSAPVEAVSYTHLTLPTKA